jgi:hypothetical protein
METPMTRSLLAVGAFLALVAAPATLAAQTTDDILGQWTFQRETPRGTMTHTVTITLQEGTLVGAMDTPRGELDLQDVSLEDGVLTFSMAAPGGRRGGGGGQPDRVQTFRGTLDGDQIAGEMETPRGAQPLVLKRVET